MDYDQIRAMAAHGISFFSDADGEKAYKIITSGGGVVIGDDGLEVAVPEQTAYLSGLVRDINIRDINGDSIKAGDKRGIFNADIPIDFGMVIYVDGEAYTVVNPRPIKPTGTVVAYRPILRRIAGV